MGTRGTFGLRYKKKDYLMYNHYDSYPEELGQNVVDFVSKVNSFQALASRVAMLEVVEETEKAPAKFRKKYAKFTQDVSSGDDWYAVLRGLQGVSFLEAVLHEEVEHIMINNEFIRDSLFCEYGYIINLDTNKLEFYKGFQKRDLKSSRYKGFPDSEYKACRLVGTAPLDNVPSDFAERFYEEK